MPFPQRPPALSRSKGGKGIGCAVRLFAALVYTVVPPVAGLRVFIVIGNVNQAVWVIGMSSIREGWSRKIFSCRFLSGQNGILFWLSRSLLYEMTRSLFPSAAVRVANLSVPPFW